MAEWEETKIEICAGENLHERRALSGDQISCNIIERACVEALQLPWTRLDHGIDYDFSDYASAPLGYCQLVWAWEKCSATAQGTFIVVEAVNRTSFAVIVGATGRQKPVVYDGNDVYTFGKQKRSKGTCSFVLSTLSKFADNHI